MRIRRHHGAASAVSLDLDLEVPCELCQESVGATLVHLALDPDVLRQNRREPASANRVE